MIPREDALAGDFHHRRMLSTERFT